MINTLPEFESRQVLTSDELNWLTCYLDSQNRQTRRFLIGCGLIGGLQVKLVNNTVQVTSGFGLTSAGHIVSVQNDLADFVTYTKVRKYEQKSKEKFAYHYLSDMDPAEEDYSKSVELASIYFQGFQQDVLELCEDTVNDATPIVANNLQDKVLMLFAEIIQKELKDCEDDNCQERGKKYLFNTRPLVIAKADAVILLNNEFGMQTTDETSIGKLAFPWLHLPNINLLKPAFSSASVNDTFDEAMVQNEYLRCINNFVEQFSLIKFRVDEALSNLKNYCSSSKSGFAIADKLIAVINSNNPAGKPLVSSQVIYDYIWCFVKAYQELQLESQALRAKCSTKESAFPNHVFAGLILAQNEDFDASISRTQSIYRHAFQSRLVQTEQAQVSRSVSILINRLRIIVEQFDNALLAVLKAIKITPGGNLYGQLSAQAIPYYLKSPISSAWSQSMSTQQNLGTYITSYPSVNESQPASISLQYNILPSAFQGDHSFFRVEGVHGHPALDALNTVFQLRKKHGLPFEVLMLRLNEKAPFSHAFNFTINEDVESMYQVVRAELIKQINLNTSYLWSLQLKDGKFEPTKAALIKALEQSYMIFLGDLNATLLTNPITMILSDAVIASNIAISNASKTEVVESKFKELQFTVAKEKQPTGTFMKKNYTAAAGLDIEAMKVKNFLPDIFEFEIGVLFFNNLGNLVNSIKSNEKFSKTTDISFYTHMLTVVKSMRKSEKLDALFLMSLQLYCSLKLQEQYLAENFLDMDIKKYKDNLNNHLLPSSAGIYAYLKGKTGELVLDDDILSSVERKEMMSYADRIRFDDDWVKIIQVDTENKKRNGGLGVENLLGRFVKIHPGLSHGFGVPKGGTYIMVYDQSNVVAADFYLPYIISSHLRPIQYTLLETKTLTLSGTVKDESGSPVATSLLIGTATILTDNQGFYNALVSESTTVKVICKKDGFLPFEKDVEIKDKPATLNIDLKKTDIKKTTIVRFRNQLNTVLTDDIILLNLEKNTEEKALAGVLTINDLPQSSHKYAVKDERFAQQEFAIVIGANDKEETVQLTQMDVVRVRITDLINERYDATLLKDIRLTDSPLEFDTSQLSKGQFVTKGKIDISKTVTVEVNYNNIVKSQALHAGEKENEVKFEDVQPAEERVLNSFVRLLYPLSDAGASVNKLSSVEINDVAIQIDGAIDLGGAEITSDGKVRIDKRFRNAPEVTIESFKKVRNAIFVMDTKLIADRTDITAKKCIATLTKALTAIQIRELLEKRKEFKVIAEKTDLNMLNFYCIVMTPAEIKVITTILKE